MNLLEKLVKQMVQLKKCLAKRGRSFTALASAVVLFMTYAMTLPVFTMDTKPVQAGTNIESASGATGGGNDQKADAAEEAKPSAEKAAAYLSKTLVLKKDGYTVTVVPNEKAQIPEGTTLSVEKIDEKSDEYKKVKELVASARNAKENELGMDALNISLFDGNGQEVEPKAEVAVKVEADNLPKEAEDITIHHIKDNPAVANADMIDGVKTLLDKSNTEEVGKAKAAAGKADVEFKTGSFSPFAVSWAKVMDAAGDEGNNEADEAEKPYSLNEHTEKITGTTVAYVKDGQTTTIQTRGDNAVNIPEGVRDFEITINYGNVNAKDVRDNHDRQISYTIPNLFDGAEVTDGTIKDKDGTQIGSIKIVQEGEKLSRTTKAVVTFDENFLDNDIKENVTIQDASMTFRAHVDSNQISENPTTVHIGNVNIQLNFEEKDVAFTGTLDITKSDPQYIPGDFNKGEDPAKMGYLQYTVTVKTGKDAMPEVKVEDSITEGSQYVAGFVKEDGSNFSDADHVSVSGSKMTWTVGDMEVNTEKSLTYRVKLKDNYVGLWDTARNNKKVITNTATPYAKTYPHASASTTYTPTVQASADKQVGEIKENGNGTITIPYTITITADNTPWPIRNVKIADNLGGNGARLSDADRAAICAAANGEGLGFQNFKIYEVNGSSNTPVVIPNHSGGNPQTHYDPNQGYDPRFDLYVGDVPAGKSLKVTYDLILNESFLTSRNGSWSITNDMTARTDDSSAYDNIGGNYKFAEDHVSKTLGQQQWDRKIQSTPTTEEIKEHPAGMEEKTVPVGSYKYQVVINEEGKWNVSGSILKDALGADADHSSVSHMQYVGYLKIDYFANGITYTDGTIPSNDETVAKKLADQTPTQTVYVNIDEQQTFALKPKDLGFNNAVGAYLLTYYATPIGLSSITTLASGNNFSLGGTVIGPGGYSGGFFGSGTYIHKDVTLEGTSQFNASKNAWYFDAKQQKLYWVIEAGGSDLTKGLTLRDITGENNSNPTFVGAYVGKINDDSGHLNLKYKNLTAFETDKTSFAELQNSTDYSVTKNGNNILDFKITNTRTLGDGEKLYLIVSSDPRFSRRNENSDLGKRNTYTANNQLQVQEAGTSSFGSPKNANLVISKNGSNFKESNRVLQRDASGSWTSLTSGSNTNSIYKEPIKLPGIYIDWRIKVNYLADLEGLVHVSDQLPKGLEPVYARYFWINSSLVLDRPTMPAISGLGNDWQQIGITAPMDGGMALYNGTSNAYYNSSTREIRFDVGNLKSSRENGIADKYSLEVQIVTKVTDEEALAGIQNAFDNTMTITDAAGIEIGRDSASATVKETSISKAVADQTNGVVPFTITVNPLSEQLAGGAKNLTVVDEMSDPLVFNLNSIKVMDGNNDITSQITISDGGRNSDDNGNILLFTVPNGKKLVISYTATPQVTANATYGFSNKAYWQGHTEGASSVDRSNQKNTIGGTASLSHVASIKVVKRDQTNLGTLLRGAKFTLQEVVWDTEQNKWVNADGSTEQVGISDNKGEIIFGGQTDNDTVQFNKVYRLTETSAPDGYFLDSTSRYVVVAQGETVNNEKTYPRELAVYQSHGAVIEYNNDQYTANIADTPMKLVLRKTDTSDKPLTGAEFILQKKDSNDTWKAYTAGDLTDGKIAVSSEGGFDIAGLTAGTYRLVETKAPDGYIITSNGDVTFTVTDTAITMNTDQLNNMVVFNPPTNGEITYTITVKNAAGTALPSTGGSGTMLFYILGVALAIGAGGISLLEKKCVRE